jgi:CDP-glucose 4,6-dehydratase
MSLWLQSMGARVIGYSQPPPTTPSLFELAHVETGIESVIGDIRDTALLTEVVAQHRPEIVFHLAAQALVRQGYQHPVETFDVNVMGTAGLLNVLRQTPGVKAIVIVTSDKCYQDGPNSVAHKETDILGGSDPYSGSKACAELVAATYRSSYFTSPGLPALATVRAGNVIGGGDWAQDRLVPDIVRAILENRLVAIRNPLAIRPWQHVLEPLSGYLLLAEKLYQEGDRFAEPWNFGPAAEDSVPVKDLVERIVEMWGEGANWAMNRDEHPHERHVLRLDWAKARQRLGWRPRWRLDQALEVTVTWYKGYAQGSDVRDLALGQLNCYQNLAVEIAR